MTSTENTHLQHDTRIPQNTNFCSQSTSAIDELPRNQSATKESTNMQQRPLTHLSDLNSPPTQGEQPRFESGLQREVTHNEDFFNTMRGQTRDFFNTKTPLMSSSPQANILPSSLSSLFHTPQRSSHSQSELHYSSPRAHTKPYSVRSRRYSNSRYGHTPMEESGHKISSQIPAPSKYDTNFFSQVKVPGSSQQDNSGKPLKEKKEKKSISTKTFAHGMMDVSLLTSNATQLRSVLSNEDHQFYEMLLWLIGVSISLQIISGILLIVSDFYKTQDSAKDRLNQRRRKVLSFVALALIFVITALNILISAFYLPAPAPSGHLDRKPTFASAGFSHRHNHSEL